MDADKRSRIERAESVVKYSNPNHDDHGRFTHGSPAAHKSLTAHGWQHAENNEYTHPKKTGHRVVIKGHSNAGGGRQRLVWEHHLPEGEPLKGEGAEALDYHLAREKQRNG